MPKRITIEPHISLEALQIRFRAASSATTAHHYQIIWLLAQGKTTDEVMAVTGYSRNWIYELVRDYNRLGPDSLGDNWLEQSEWKKKSAARSGKNPERVPRKRRRSVVNG
jgi:predicted DNA-binding transcriptional regulator AlpA